ncbi:N-acetylmuramoyl-L-alanine amidase [Candidatus Sumerlaeota bacterium]|nr:N-acetylmuramoyl-L-alanine amidase [Candidatus Sumerlaeota bacterium]
MCEIPLSERAGFWHIPVVASTVDASAEPVEALSTLRPSLASEKWRTHDTMTGDSRSPRPNSNRPGPAALGRLVVAIAVVLVWVSPTQAQDGPLTIHLADGRNVACPVQSIGTERYVSVSNVNDLLRILDPSAATQWNASTGVYRAQAAGCDFSLYQRQAMLLCNNAIIQVRLPLLAARGTVFIPLDSLARVLKYFEGVEAEIPRLESRVPGTTYSAPDPANGFPQAVDSTQVVPSDFAESVQEVVDATTPAEAEDAAHLARDLDRAVGLLTGRTTVVIDPEPADLTPMDWAAEGAPAQGGGAGAGPSGSDLTLRVARRCREILASNPAFQVVLTRDSDTEKASMDKRIQIANISRPRALVCLRVDGSGFKAPGGYRLYTVHEAVDPSAPDAATRDSLGKTAAAEAAYVPYENAGLLLARLLDEEMVRGGLVRGLGGLRLAPFYVPKRVAAPSVTVSLGYLSNEADSARFGEAAYVEAAAASLAQGLLRFGHWLDSGFRPEAIE